MYKLVQNYLQDNEYEYAEEFTDINEALKRQKEYEAEDKKENKYHNYTIIDNETYEEAGIKEDKLFKSMAMSAMKDIGLTDDEAEMQFEDIGI